MPDLNYYEEPNLLFDLDQSTKDPRDGLTLFGPYERFSPYSMQVGVVGTDRGIDLYRAFVDRLQRPFLSSSIKRPSFPGFEAAFGVSWTPDPAMIRIIEHDFIEEDIALPSLKQRTYHLVSRYLDEIKKVTDEEEAHIDLWFIVVPREVWIECRLKSKDKPDVSKDELLAFQRGQRSLFSETNEQYEALSSIFDYHSDFHHQLKARLLQERIGVPVQVILEPTLQFLDKFRGWEFSDEMKAHVAWTQSTTAYYKLGKLPWKLADIRQGVCYLGLVFKKFERLTSRGYACSAAQMFLDSGDGTVFKGNIGPWKSRTSNEFHLDKASAKELLTLALESYLFKRESYPTEVFIHGRASFDDDEWRGFREAIGEMSPKTQLVGIVIKESEKLKLFRNVIGEDCRYGNLRGLGLSIDDSDGYLWTRGFVPRLNTSTSLEIPNPLRIKIDRCWGDGDAMDQVLRDILALSKLNYNACIYGDGLPVTLRFSDMIGSILTAVDGIEEKVLPFKYYI